MKRVIGIPGDTIEIRNKQVVLNSIPIDDKSYTQRVDPLRVPDNTNFVLGDNRAQTLDSRFFGMVNAAKISGKVTVIYWSWFGHGKLSECVR